MNYALVGADWGHLAAFAGGLVAVVTRPEQITHPPRYIFCLNYSHRLSPWFVRLYECVNFHCTPLPFGRGGHPIENLILRGWTETVITAHRMTDEIDAGPIYNQVGPVSLAGTKAEICHRFIIPCAAMIRMIVQRQPKPRPQRGDIVAFHRLSADQCGAIWQGRA